MKERLFHKFSGKFAVAFMILLLFAVGGCYIGTDSSVAMAAESAVTLYSNTETMEEYYVKEFTGTQFNTYKSGNTYPKLGAGDCANAQDYLFAGWYQSKNDNGSCGTAYGEETTELDASATVYAKFVPSGVLTVKCQVTPDTDASTEKTNMRLVSTTDSHLYSAVGFDVVYKGRFTNCYTDTLYKRISATDDGMASGYSPNAFDETSKYFFSVRLKNIGKSNYAESLYIQPYWKTMDGTKVYGECRFVRIEDSYKKILNLPARLYSDETVTNGTVTMQYNANQFDLYAWDGATKKTYTWDNGTTTEETVFDTVTLDNQVVDGVGTITLTGTSASAVAADGIFANVRLQLKEGQLIESNTTFAVTNNGFTNGSSAVTFEVSDVLYKNYALEYDGNPDISWYVGFEDNDTYVISTAADLYGLAELVNKSGDETTQPFTGKTIKLGADIVVNKDLENNPYMWIPIGMSTTYQFGGTFDGQGNVIKGIYFKDDAEILDPYRHSTCYFGLFGITSKTSAVKNFELRDSYFESVTGTTVSGSQYALMGSIIGQMAGDADTLYSNATVVSAWPHVGGVIGRVNASGNTSSSGASSTGEITNCWFDGRVTVHQSTYSAAISAGGVIGRRAANNAIVTDCLNTGTISYTYDNNPAETVTKYDVSIGGIVGYATAAFNVSECVNAGTISIQDSWDESIAITNSSEICNGAAVQSNNLPLVAEGLSKYNGHIAYEKMSSTQVDGVEFYNQTDNTDGRWVCREANSTDAIKGIPVLKSFCDEWIDVAWYYDTANYDAGGNEFVIDTVEELYGFSVISQSYKFRASSKQDTVRLAADIKVNSGDASEWKKGNVSPDTKRVWTPISSNHQSYSFEGIFDGKDPETGEIYTISGIWVDQPDVAGYGSGLFGYTKGTLQNFRLENSYINTIMPYSGTVAGFFCGNMYNVYSNAYIKSNAADAGGLVGRYGGNYAFVQAEEDLYIKGCWFDGEVESSAQYAGGIAGNLKQGNSGNTKHVEDCLVTGTITSTFDGAAYVGGISGSANSSMNNLGIKNCLNACKAINAKEGATEVGSFIGQVNITTNLTLENVYTTSALGGIVAGLGNSSTYLVKTVNGVQGKPAVYDEADLQGLKGYINTEFDFENTWAAVEGSVPVPKALYEEETITDLTAQRASTDWYYNNVTFTTGSTLTDATPTYTIQDAADLYGFSQISNGGAVQSGVYNAVAYNFSGKTVQLAEDGNFDLNPGWTVTVKDGSVTTSGTATAWTPIGFSKDAFSGTTYDRFAGHFNGNGNTIKGLYVNKSQSYAGLFGYINANGSVTNFTLENSYIKGAGFAAAIAGNLGGSASDIYVKDSVAVDCGNQVGAIAGRVYDATEAPTITNCWVDGLVKASGTYSGGIVGALALNGATVSDCLMTGDIISTGTSATTGGIVGATTVANIAVTIQDCLAAGTMKVSTATKVGAVFGTASSTSADITIQDVYYVNEPVHSAGSTIDLTTNTTTGLGSGTALAKLSGAAQQLTTEELAGTGAYKYTELDLASTTENTEGAWVLRNDGVPQLNKFADSDVNSYAGVERRLASWYYNGLKFATSGTATMTNTAFEIQNAGEMFGFADIVNDGVSTFENMTVSLKNKITINDVQEGDLEKWANGNDTPTSWTPIGTTASWFKGTFEGNDNSIEGLYLKTSKQYAGLFGCSTGNLQNFRLTNSYLETTYKSSARACFGSILGLGDGNLTNVYSDAIMKSEAGATAGFVGYVCHDPNNSGTASYNTEAALTIKGCWFNGDITVDHRTKGGAARVGGMVGEARFGATTVDTSLYTGDILFNYANISNQAYYNSGVAGICGVDSADSTVVVKDSIVQGTIDANWYHAPFTATPDAAADLAGVGCVIGSIVNAGTATQGQVYAETAISKEIETASQTFTGNTTQAYGTKGSSITANITTYEEYAKENLYGLGAQVLSNWAFTRAAEDTTTPIWVARLGELPIPTSFTDLVDNELEIGTLGKADTSWYADDAKVDGAYIIDSVEDLYGFAILAKDNDFAEQTVKLGANITISDNATAEEWEEGTPAELPWYPIGQNTDEGGFAGTFDGQNHSIQGIYVKQDIKYMGLFAMTSQGSTLQKFDIVDSYIENTRTVDDGYAGSVAGEIHGNIDTVYSNAIVHTITNEIGGLVARASAEEQANITNCWFDGKVVGGEDSRRLGGLVGAVSTGTLNLENVLFTGQIDAHYTHPTNGAYVGGFVGVAKGALSVNVHITSALSAGKINIDQNHKLVGSIVGCINNGIYKNGTTAAQPMNPEFVLKNVFASRDCYEKPYSVASQVKGTLITQEAVEDDPETTDVDESVAAVTESITSAVQQSGTVLQMAGNDRLFGYGTQGTAYDAENTIQGDVYNEDEQHTLIALDFNEDWTLRRNDVPVLKCFADMDTNSITTIDAAAMAKEIGLDYWNSDAVITDATASGGGNYLVTYNTTETLTYDEYIEILKTAIGSQTKSGHEGLGFELYADNSASDMDTDGIVSSTYYKAATETTGEWVLHITYTKADNKIYISIGTDVEKQAPTLKADNTLADDNGTGTISLSMVELVTTRYGNSFVFQLPNGHFIVSDGGETGDAEVLVEHLHKLAGEGNPVYIDAWMITHFHGDHAGALHAFYEDTTLREGIYLNAVYVSEPSRYALTSWSESHTSLVDNALRGAKTLTKTETDLSKPNVYQMHMGQRYYFDGMTMDVIDTQEQHPFDTWNKYSDPDKFNATSTNCLFTFKDANGATKKVLMGGDSTNVNMRYIMDVYGKSYTTYDAASQQYGGTSDTLSDVNIFVAYHHGKNTTSEYFTYHATDIKSMHEAGQEYLLRGTASNEWADYLLKNTKNSMTKFDAVLFPYHQVYDTFQGEKTKVYDSLAIYPGQVFTFKLYEGDDGSTAFSHNLSETNQYFKDNATRYYTYGYEDVLASDKADTHGTVTIEFDGSNTATAETRKADIDQNVEEAE